MQTAILPVRGDPGQAVLQRRGSKEVAMQYRQGMWRLGRKSLMAAAIATALTGCAKVAEEQLTAGLLPPVVNPITEINRSLRELPPPPQKVAVAVYNFSDQTGQFKPSETTQTLSKAVTQGATSILIKALQDTGQGNWFTVVERERIDNLLKERSIITQMRMVYLGEKRVNPKALPPLLFAAILFEGGIIGYDTNIQTGGIGARLLGIGGDVKYRLDTITIYLRAVSTKTGQVLASVTTHKTIASIGLQGGVFKYIAVDKILEAEAGFTKNEPDQLAIQQAIEKAVYTMILEGAAADIWSFADKKAQAELLGAYREGQPLAAATIQNETKTASSLQKKDVAIAAKPEGDKTMTSALPASSGQSDATTPDKPAAEPKSAPWNTSLANAPPLPERGPAETHKVEIESASNEPASPWMTSVASVKERFTHSVNRQ